MEYKLLFCLSNNIEKIKKHLINYGYENGYTFHIEQVTTIHELTQLQNLDTYNCIILQEYLSLEKPISIDFLCDFIIPKNKNLICIFDKARKEDYSQRLYELGLFNCFFGDDISLLAFDSFMSILLNGRNENEVKKYYGIKNNYYQQKGEEIHKLIKKLTNAANQYKEDEELLNDEVEDIIKSINDYDLRILITEMPFSIVEMLLCVPRIYKQYCILSKITNKPAYVVSNQKTRVITIGRKNIGVANLSGSAGATFFTMNFAYALSKYVSVAAIEFPILEPYLYTYLGLNTLCENDTSFYTSYAHLIDKNLKANGKIYSSHKNLAWLVNDATKHQIKNWDSIKMLKLLNSSREATINIVDLGHELFHSSIKDIIEQFNMLIIIIDPMIPNILNNIEFLDKIKQLMSTEQININFVINKAAKGIDIHELLEYLDIAVVAELPFIEPKYIYQAVYAATVPYANNYVKNKLEEPFNKIIKLILPDKILRESKKIEKIFKKA